MPTYIVLGKLTQEGVKKIKKASQQFEAAQEVLKSVGGEIKEFYYTLGQYDFVAIAEGPGTEEVMKALFVIGSEGMVRTETLVAVPFEKVVEMVKEMT